MINRRNAFLNLLSITCSHCLLQTSFSMDMDSSGISHSEKSAHPIFNLEFWKSFLKDRIKAMTRAEVAQPENLLAVLAKREELKLHEVLKTKERPADLFLWMLGESRFPWLTRYGGVPFRSKSKPWPERSGVDATFLGQLCFRDSLDLFDFRLPGDLMLIFSFEKIPYTAKPTDMDQPLLLEWVRIDDVVDPLTKGDITPKRFEVPALSGVRFRTVDFQILPHELSNFPLRLSDAGSRWHSLLSLPGTKIGTSYFEVQTDFDPTQWVKKDLTKKANLLGTFYSVGGNYLLNPELKASQSYDFYFGDPGHLVLFDVETAEPIAYSIYG